VEQVNARIGFRVYAREIGSLVKVALRAGPAEVVGVVNAAMHNCHDVIDVKR
jgi:hypothetical protein